MCQTCYSRVAEVRKISVRSWIELSAARHRLNNLNQEMGYLPVKTENKLKTYLTRIEVQRRYIWECEQRKKVYRDLLHVEESKAQHCEF